MERSAYADFVRTDDDQTNNAIRQATRTGRPFGSDNFIDSLEFSLAQTLRPRRAGRPRKEQ